MPTTVTRYINAGSTSGGDGTTNATSGANRAWATWNEAIVALNSAYTDLVASDVLIDLRVTGLASQASAMTLPTFTRDATRYLLVQPETGQEHAGKYDSSKAGIQITGTFNNGWSSTTNHSFIKWRKLILERNSTSTTDGTGFAFQTSAYEGLLMDSCVFHRSGRASATGGDALVFESSVVKAGTIVNCVFSGSWFNAIRTNRVSSGGAITLYNNTMVGFFGNGILYQNMAADRSRNINNRMERAAGNTNACYVTNLAQTTGTNFTDDATSPDGASFQSKTGTYVDAVNFDYRLAAGDAGIGQATDLSADATYPFSTDFIGTTRSAWDIGASEYVVAASGGFRPYFITG